MAQDSHDNQKRDETVASHNEAEVRRTGKADPPPEWQVGHDRSRAQASGNERRSESQRKSDDERQGGGSGRTLIGLGLGLATAGAAAFFFAKSREDDYGNGPLISDAPDHVLRGKALQNARNTQSGTALVGKTVTINKPRQELYAFWRAFERFPEFMDNVREIKRVDETRSEWLIEAPMGATVNVKTRIIEDEPGTTIAWASEPDSQIETSGRVEFADAPPGRGTYVRLVMRYTPPAGGLGRFAAKVLQREPSIQARRDLRRFKQLMETGEVATNASPSARKADNPPTETHV